MTNSRTIRGARSASSAFAPLPLPVFGSTRCAPWRWSRMFRLLRFCSALTIPTTMVLYAGGAVYAAPVATSDSYMAFVGEASQRFDIPTAWLQAVIHIESGGFAHAISPKGAMGLMQLMPDTWSSLRARYHLGAEPLDPHDNIIAGAAYLRELLDRFGTSGFLGAYNAGPKRFEDYLAGLRPLAGETRHYLSRLAQMLPDVGIATTDTDAIAPVDGRFASLFVGASSALPLPGHAPIDRPAADIPNAHRFALSPQSNGLFVPVNAPSPER